MRGRRVFGDVVLYFYVKREDGEGGAGWSSVQKVWDEMNNKNRKLVNQWMKSSANQANTDRTIGVDMAEVVE